MNLFKAKKNYINTVGFRHGIFSFLIGIFLGSLIPAMGWLLLIKDHTYQFHDAEVLRKKNIQSELANDAIALNSTLSIIAAKCASKNFPGFYKLQEDMINLKFKLVGDKNKYQIIFGKEALESVVNSSNQITESLKKYEELITFCKKSGPEEVSIQKFSEDFSTVIKEFSTTLL